MPNFSIHIPDDVKRELDAKALEHSCSRNSIVNSAIHDWMLKENAGRSPTKPVPEDGRRSTRGQPGDASLKGKDGGVDSKDHSDKSSTVQSVASGAGSSEDSPDKLAAEDSDIPLVEALRVKGLSSKSQGTVMGDGKLLLNGLIGLRSRSRSL